MRSFTAVLFIVVAGYAGCSAGFVSPADIVFYNGSVYTLDIQSSKVAALAAKDGVIIFTGSSEGILSFIGNETKVVDLHGRTATPGLVDSHMHVLSGGLFLMKCDLNYQPLDLQAVLSHVKVCIDGETNTTRDTWLEVVNMDYPTLVTRSGPVGKIQLDTLRSPRPIILRSSDYHTVLANTRALELSAITSDTPDPPNGKIERLLGGNEPSGVLQDSAANLLAGPPLPTVEENKRAGRAALKLLREAGITTFQEAAASETHHTVFQAIEKEGGLSSRAFFDYRIEAPTSLDGVAALVARTIDLIRSLHGNSTIQAAPSLTWQAVKLFVDGVITYPANTAAVIDPYWLPINGSDNVWAPDNSSLVTPYWSGEILSRTLEGLFLAGIDAQLHADGDLAVRLGLNAAESFRNKHPDRSFRLGLAHDELSHQDDWSRFAKLGVDAIMSFQWAQLSSFYIPSTFASLAEYRRRNLQAYAEIEKAGRPVVYGSDWPIDPLDEFLALKVGVTRSGDPQNPNSPASQGAPYDGVFPGEGISREAAFRAITINGAKFLRADQYIGSLEIGKFADVIVLENDYFTVPEAVLGRQKVLLTMVGGTVVYIADGAGIGFESVQPSFLNRNETLVARTIQEFDHSRWSKKGRPVLKKMGRSRTCMH